MDVSMSSMKDFVVIKQVGKGSYGVVYKVRRKSDNRIYAIKTICLSKNLSQSGPLFLFEIVGYRVLNLEIVDVCQDAGYLAD